MKNKVLAGFLMKTKQMWNNKINTDVEHSQNLSTWISQIFQFVFMFRVESPRPWREHRPNCTKHPQHERKLQPRSDPADPADSLTCINIFLHP